MTKRKQVLTLAGAAWLGGFLWRQGVENTAASVAEPVAPARMVRENRRAPAASRESTLAASAAPATTRRAAIALIQTLYRKEQLTRELDLEQRRYGRNYWEPGRNGRELAKLQQAREAMLQELTAEANQVLHDFFPDDAGEPIAFAAIFDAEHPGPNVTFLSPPSLERFESEILAEDDGPDADRARLLGLAARVLSADEMESYRNWNDRASSALREQLVGFNPTETEFAAILHETLLTAEDGEAHGAGGELATLLGPTRFGELLKLQDPAMQTALQDLQRLGLPLDEAEWLAATRTRAIAEMGETWQSAALTDAMKREQVAQLERAYGQTIASKLALPEGSLDGISPGS